MANGAAWADGITYNTSGSYSNQDTIDGDGGTGVTVSASPVEFTNDGTITTSGSLGIYATDVAELEIDNSGTIQATASDSLGIYVAGTSETFTLENSGTISGVYRGIDSRATTTTITNDESGVILGGSSSTHAIYASGTLDLTNAGLIESDGTGSYAVYSSGGTITNSGTISGHQASIWSDGNLKLVNSGSLTNAAYGVYMEDGTLDLTNSGTISGAYNAVKLASGTTGNTITNSGSLWGELAGILDEGTDTSINNSGSIKGGTNGIQTTSGANITNSGTITGEDGYGIYAENGGVTITTSGTISGTEGSIYFGSGGNTLNIESGAVFDGVVNYNSTTDNTTNFGTGSYSVSVANYLTADNTINLSSDDQTLIVNSTNSDENGVDGTMDVVETSAVASQAAATSSYTATVEGVMSDILDINVDTGAGASDNGSSSNALGFADDTRARIASVFRKVMPGVGTDGHGNMFWVRAFGGQHFDHSNDATSSNLGVAAGVDHSFGDKRLGVLIGTGNMVNQADDHSSKSKADMGFGGVYLRQELGLFTVDTSVIGGGSYTRSEREIVGSDDAVGHFGGWYVTPELKLLHAIDFAPNWSLTPSAAVRYTAGVFNGFNEHGSTQNIDYDKRIAQSLETVVQAKLAHNVLMQNGLFGTFGILGEVVDTSNFGDATMDASLADTDFTVRTTDSDNVFGGRVGFNAQVALSKRAALYANTKLGLYSDDSRSWAANAGVKVAF